VSRVLTATRVVVAPGRVGDWLATLEVLARRLTARGQHLWVFQRDGAPGEWLEFTEGKDLATHRSQGPVDAVEAELEARLRALGEYDDESAGAVWREVRLGAD
jgi:hypothetical protein